jgi:hypothetical protein
LTSSGAARAKGDKAKRDKRLRVKRRFENCPLSLRERAGVREP